MSELKLLHAPQKNIDLLTPVYLGDLPNFNTWQEMRLVQEENNNRWLFFIRDSNNLKLALYIFVKHSYDYFYRVKQFQDHINIFMSKLPYFESRKNPVIDFGLLNCGKYVYFLMPWQHDCVLSSKIKEMSVQSALKPALCIASYLKAIENISSTDSLRSYKEIQIDWSKKIDRRIKTLFNKIKYINVDIAAIEHFTKFYEEKKHILQNRKINIYYNNFVPENWYYQMDETVSIPLIFDWESGDVWYTLCKLLSEIYPANENLAVFLIDAYFNFEVPKDFFPCLAIYNMLELFDQLVSSEESQKQRKQIIASIRELDHMFSKFTLDYPAWYKIIISSGR